eukprot:1915157-Amphidinium_carterae.1
MPICGSAPAKSLKLSLKKGSAPLRLLECMLNIVTSLIARMPVGSAPAKSLDSMEKSVTAPNAPTPPSGSIPVNLLLWISKTSSYATIGNLLEWISKRVTAVSPQMSEA